MNLESYLSTGKGLPRADPCRVRPHCFCGYKETSQESLNDSGNLNWGASSSAGGTSPWLTKACCKKPFFFFSLTGLLGKLKISFWKTDNLKSLLIQNLSKYDRLDYLLVELWGGGSLRNLWVFPIALLPSPSPLTLYPSPFLRHLSLAGLKWALCCLCWSPLPFTNIQQHYSAVGRWAVSTVLFLPLACMPFNLGSKWK